MNTIKYSLKMVYRKSQDMIFFSQLDIMRVLERALRRARLPLYFTQGYKPHVKMSFNKALKLGVEGEEEVIFYFTEKLSAQDLTNNLLAQLPHGLQIIKIIDL